MTTGLLMMNSGDNIYLLWAQANIEHKEHFNKLLLEKRFTMKETDQPYRVVNHWCEKGLIEDNRQEGSTQWRKFSLADIIWFNIISELRSFGMSLDQIKNIKENLEIYPKSEHTLSMFHVHILLAMQNTLTQVVVYQDSNAGISSDSGVTLAVQTDNYPSHLIISINNILDRCFKKNTLKDRKATVTFASSDEQRVLNSLRSGNVQKVTVKLRDGKITLIERDDNPDVEKRVVGLLSENKFQTITLQEENGKIVSISRTVKEKL